MQDTYFWRNNFQKICKKKESQVDKIVTKKKKENESRFSYPTDAKSTNIYTFRWKFPKAITRKFALRYARAHARGFSVLQRVHSIS